LIVILDRTYSRNLSNIVPIETTIDAVMESPRSDILLYDKITNSADIYTIDHHSKTYQGWSDRSLRYLRTIHFKGDSYEHIVPIPFESHTNLLFYQGLRKVHGQDLGMVDIYRYISSRELDYDAESSADRGQGNLAFLKSMVTKNWTHIVPGCFGGEYGGLFFYDSSSGEGKLLKMDRNGNINLLHEHTDFSKGWSHIVPVPYGFRTDLFFYNAQTGYGGIYHVDPRTDSFIEFLPLTNKFSKDWIHIIPIPMEESFNEKRHDGSPLLLFLKNNEYGKGHGEIYNINDSDFIWLYTSDDFSANWSQIIAIPAFALPIVYRIRIHAVVTGEDNGLTFTSYFNAETLKNVIDATNLVFRESGIQFMFDPANDVDEIKSSLLNRDFAWDANGQQTIYPVTVDKKTGVGFAEVPLTKKGIGAHEGLPWYENGQARMQFGWRNRGKLVVLFRDWPNNDTKNRQRGIGQNYSGCLMGLAVFQKTATWDRGLAHELGHYLNATTQVHWSTEQCLDPISKANPMNYQDVTPDGVNGMIAPNWEFHFSIKQTHEMRDYLQRERINHLICYNRG
jgi:hypothetical protein